MSIPVLLLVVRRTVFEYDFFGTDPNPCLRYDSSKSRLSLDVPLSTACFNCHCH